MADSPPPYRVGRLLGRGAVASVHEVFDAQGERFAGKFLHASRDGDALASARFRQEAALLEGVAHPNLVRVYGEAEGVDADADADADIDAGEGSARRSFVRMEHVGGPSFDVLLAREAPLREAQVIDFGHQLAAGLAHAHARGIVHRDLKPANVLVSEADDGGARVLKIADFGMARASSLSGLDARALTILGTPDYMAPESLDPLAVDARADLYALGCMLFEMLTGEVPYPAATPFGILRRHRDDPLPSLGEDGSIAPELRALVGALMAKSPADRPPSAGLVADRLGALASTDAAQVQSLALVAGRLDSRCASCDQPLIEHIPVCLNCGLAAVKIEAGDHHVVITGPGEIGDKLDSGLRTALLEWLSANPQLGLAPGKSLATNIPRLPFVFVSGLSEGSAAAMLTSLTALGLAGEAHLGGALSHAGVRKKVGKLAGRIGLIALGTTASMWQHAWFWAALPIAALVGIGVTAFQSGAAVTETNGRASAALGPGLRAAFERVEAIAPALDEARHRHALRALVRQSLDLREQLGPEVAETELAAAVDRASVTTAALARIDTQLRARDLNSGDDDTRALLHQRDQLAGRLASLAGSLETLRIRARRSQRQPQPDIDAELDELRLRVEALEELQAS